MLRSSARVSFLVAVSLMLLSVTVPAASQTPTTYLTTGLAQSGIVQTTIAGNTGVLVNFTSSYSFSFAAFVYLDVVNSAGQTVYWNIASCNFGANQKVSCLVPIFSPGLSGDYTGKVFATTTSSVPVSATSSIKVTL